MAAPVYKYLSADLALRVLESMRIKVSLLTELNDVFDCSPTMAPPIDEPGHTPETWTKHIITQNSKNYGLLCLSKNLRNPLQWGHYSACGAGIALGFDPDKFPWKNPIEVRYDHARPHVHWASEDQINAQFVDHMLRCSFGVKAREWAYEQEMRYVLALDTCTPQNGMYFAPFPKESLVEVVLGYRCRVPTTYLQHFLARNYAGCPVTVRIASPHPTNYEIEVANVAS